MQIPSNPIEQNDLALLPQEHTVDMRELYYAVTDKIRRLIVIAILAAVGFGVLFRSAGVSYDSTASVYVGTGSDMLTYEQVEAGYLLVDDCMEIFGSRDVLEQVIDEQRLNESYEDFLGRVTIGNAADSHIITITVRYRTAQEAQRCANSLLAAGSDRITEFLGSGVVRTVQSAAFPTEPVIRPVVAAVLVGMLVAIFGVGLRVLRYLFSARLVTPGDVETHLSLEVLGGLFREPRAGDRSGRPADGDAGKHIRDQFMTDELNLDCLRRLRSCILDRGRGRIRSILVAGTSGDEENGMQRTMAALSLAAALTETGKKTVFIDLDRYVRTGLLSRLAVSDEIKNAQSFINLDPLFIMNGGAAYTSGGDGGRPRQAGLMAPTSFRQEAFAGLVSWLSEAFPYVVISASDALPVAEVGKCVDAVVVAIASDADDAGAIRAMHRQLEHSGCRVIGAMMYGLGKTRRVFYSVFGTTGKDRRRSGRRTRR